MTKLYDRLCSMSNGPRMIALAALNAGLSLKEACTFSEVLTDADYATTAEILRSEAIAQLYEDAMRERVAQGFGYLGLVEWLLEQIRDARRLRRDQ